MDWEGNLSEEGWKTRRQSGVRKEIMRVVSWRLKLVGDEVSKSSWQRVWTRVLRTRRLERQRFGVVAMALWILSLLNCANLESVGHQ